MDEHDGHPSAFRLEAFHAGEPDASTAAHVGKCAECAEYLASLEEARASFAQRPGAGDFLDRVTASSPGTPPQRRRLFTGLLIAAALMAVFIGRWAFVRTLGEPSPGERLKGGPVLAAIVLRDGVQRRETGTITLRAGDRVRFEVGGAGPLRVVVQEAGGPARTLYDGPAPETTTILPDTLAVDDRPTEATVLAGPPDAVARGPGPEVASLRLTSGP